MLETVRGRFPGLESLGLFRNDNEKPEFQMLALLYSMKHTAKDKIEEWRIEYNAFRLHSSLDYKTPEEFLKQCEQEGLNKNTQEATLQVV